MKRIIIVLAVILTSALTALSVTRKEVKAENKVSLENKAVMPNHTTSLATAD